MSSSVSSSITDEKKAELRRSSAKIRKLAHHKHSGGGASLVHYADLLLTRFSPRVISGFWPVRSEIDMRPLLHEFSAQQVQVCLPITGAAETPLTFRAWHPDDLLETGSYDIPEPMSSRPLCQADLMFVPLLAFDDQRNRLGYGGGYYDRTLAQYLAAGHKFIAIGVAFDEQQVEHVPIGIYDRPLDAILTPSGIRM